jgi:hypothetical protein
MKDNVKLLIGIAVAAIVLFIFIWLVRKFSDKIGIFIRDTMKEKQSDGYWKWSRTSIILVSSWFCVVYAYFFDLTKNGFNFETFCFMGAIATGIPITSAYSKKLNPLIQPPNSNEESNGKI